MPFKSAKQRRFMYAAARGGKLRSQSTIGQKAAKRFIAHSTRKKR